MGDAGVAGLVPFPSDSCLFPALDTTDTQSHDVAEEYLPIDLEKKDQFRRFCDSQGIELIQLLQLTWAIVLRTYTGSKSPMFKYVDGQNSGLLCSLNLSEKDETASLARNFDFWEDAALGNAQHSVNSAIIWNTRCKSLSEEVRSKGEPCRS